MTGRVLVAPREIVDVVYRASRVAGADSGVASMLGRSACFAVGQLGSDLSHVVEALDEGQAPPLGFVPVAKVESGGFAVDGSLVVDAATYSVADLAYAAFSACTRGCVVSMVCGDGVVHAPHSWLSTGRSALLIEELRVEKREVDAGLAARVTARHDEALRHGLSIPETTWRALADRATPYLVPERLIDAAEGEPAN
ncbi:MAG: hypothetical protein R8J94_19075 [Acidimicrobiia bacterium]|nr:hypothetical protein [Acidimicrobiia bacterium]